MLPVSVEEYVPHEFEAILGLKYDPTFGPALLFGLGGVFAEAIGDFVVRLAPLQPRDVTAMLTELKAAPVLQKAHTLGKIDLPALEAALGRVSLLAEDLGSAILALDVNPVALLPAADGALKVLDAKAELHGAEPGEAP